MEVCAVLGELLYIVSNFEKGRYKTEGLWSIRYKTSLRESLFFMLTIVQLIKKDICFSESTRGAIVCFYKKNINIIFHHSNFNIDVFADVLEKTYICSLADEQSCVIGLMEKILYKCIELQNMRFLKHKQKRELSLLLKSLHNLPRAFFDPSKHALCDAYVSALQPREAISFATSYLLKTTCSENILSSTL